MGREAGELALPQRAQLGMPNEQRQGQICALEVPQEHFLEQ